MMRNFILVIFIVIPSLLLQAQSVNGIRVDAGNNLVLVYLDGKQISLPASSCFIANLTNGRYIIEAYDANAYLDRVHHYRGKLVYRKSILYKGQGIEDLVINDYVNHRPLHPSYPQENPYYPDEYYIRGVMSPTDFDIFLQTLKDETFESSQFKMLETAVINSLFTTNQCKRILELCNFDSERIKFMKLLYPTVVDKQNFFKVINKFDFDSSKEEMSRFIKDYHQTHRR